MMMRMVLTQGHEDAWKLPTSFMWTMVPNETDRARPSLVIAGPISHGCILTLVIDEENDSAAFNRNSTRTTSNVKLAGVSK